MLQGSIVALVTPMFPDGQIDWDAYRALIDWHIEQGSDALVVVGTTGESPTVNVEEHAELIKVAVSYAAKRIPIIAGTGGNSTAEAIELTQYAKTVGADYSLSVVPYYNKPGQEGLYRHFKTIAEAIDIPTILYNVPGRTVADMNNETVVRLSAIENIVGIKDATGNLDRGAWLIRSVPDNFAVYSGDDATAIFLMLAGGKGNISVTANVAPRLMHDMCVASINRNVETAMRLHYQLLPLHKQLFVEANPIPVKWAMSVLGKAKNGIRLPLTELSEAGQIAVKAAIKEAGVMNV